MKAFSTIFLSCLFTISAFAQYGQTVTIMFAGNGRGNSNDNNGKKSFEVIIDGRSYSTNDNYGNNRNDGNGNWNNNLNSITINNLQVGQHSIMINGNRNNNSKSGSINSNNTAAYSSNFSVKHGYDLHILIKPNGAVSYTDQPVNNNAGRSGNRNNDRKDGRDGDWKNNNGRRSGDKDDDIRGDRRSDRRSGKDGDWRDNNGGYNDRRNDNGGYNNRYPNNRSNMAAMPEVQFNELLQNVRGKWFQSGKVSAVKDAFNNTGYYFSTYQVRQLLTLVTSEDSRVELAKLSYKNVVDKSSFSQLYDLFSQSNQDELDRYIRSNRY